MSDVIVSNRPRGGQCEGHGLQVWPLSSCLLPPAVATGHIRLCPSFVHAIDVALEQPQQEGHECRART